MKLNLACGDNKIEGFVNVDINLELKPDMVFSITQRFPLEDNSVEEAVLFHVMEHIRKIDHVPVILELWRVLTPGGKVIFTFPEFLACAKNWEENKMGLRDFWEATLYGRQSSPHDFHVALMNVKAFAKQLELYGFDIVYAGPEKSEQHNSKIICKKGRRVCYEDLVKDMTRQTLEN